MGGWYELAHYPSWFQHNDEYNTTAEYTLLTDGSVKVVNSTSSVRGNRSVVGTARQINGPVFRVDFPPSEMSKIPFASSAIENMPQFINANSPNYVVDKLWTNRNGDYIFAVVTNLTKSSLWVLSRFSHPSSAAYEEVMRYVSNNYDKDKLVQTAHYD